MAYSADSFSAGEQPTTSKFNKLWSNDASFNDGTGIANLEIGSGHTSLKNDYKFSVYRNTAWTTGNFAATVVQFDTKLYDTGSNLDIVTNKGRFTAPVTGYYHFSSGVDQAALTSGNYVYAALYKNGSIAKLGSSVTSGTSSINPGCSQVSGDLQLSASDYVEIYFFGNNTSGATGVQNAYFDGHLISMT